MVSKLGAVGAVMVIAAAGAAAIVQDATGILLSPGLLLTMLVEFVGLVFLAAKVVADAHANTQFRKRMEPVPETLARMDERLKIIERYMEDQQDGRGGPRTRERWGELR